MRHDGYLYTGINSVTQERKSVRERTKERKEELQVKLQPAAELIFERIEAEKARMGEMLAELIDSKQTPHEVQTHIEAVKLHRQWVDAFELQFKADLRQGRVPTIEPESFDE